MKLTAMTSTLAKQHTMEVIKEPPQDVWETVVRSCEHATFFHTPTWVNILEKTFPQYKNATLEFIFTTGSKALFPLVAEHSPGILFKKRVKHKSMPLGVYGGVVAERGFTREEHFELLAYITSSEITDLKVVQNPLTSYPFPSSFERKSFFTHIIQLDSDFTQVSQRFSRGQKSNIKQAQKKGVVIRTADSRNDYEQYYHLYQATLKRWGERTGTAYPWDLFANLFEAHHPDIQLWLAEKEGIVIAGVIVFYCNTNILYWHGASLREYFDHYPNNLLHAEIIRDGCERGYKIYDLNPSGGHSGVIQFKKSFSAKQVDCTAYHWKKQTFHFLKRSPL